MTTNGISFLDKVLKLIKEETAEDVPLIQFKHPKELEVSGIRIFFLTPYYYYLCYY